MITVQFGTRSFFVTEWSFIGVVPEQRDSGFHAGLGHDIQTIKTAGQNVTTPPVPPNVNSCVFVIGWIHTKVMM